VTGMLAYCEHYNRRLGLVFVGAWAVLPMCTLGGWMLGLRGMGDVVAVGVFSYLAYIAWVTARRCPGTGHRQLALAMLSYPAILVALGLLALEPQHIRYLASAPFTMIGVLLLSVTLNRQNAEREQTRLALAQLNAELEQRVHDRTLALEHNLQALQRTQTQLVQTEKLAALGRLVAGVAHELNTPLGNMLVTATALNERAEEVLAAHGSGSLRCSQLAEFLQGASQASGLIERNTRRAADLVSTFKRVSVDQASLQRRRFALAQVVDDCLRMLEPVLRQSPLQWDMALAPDLVMDSYPGPLEQVLTNLVQNAQIHALGQRAVLHLRIAAVPELREQPGVRLEFSDDGEGMAPEVARQAFDPYFSTRFGQGGSGLGLYIVYGLVTGTLGGSIELHSTRGQGTHFTLWLPLQAPWRPESPDHEDALLHPSPFAASAGTR